MTFSAIAGGDSSASAGADVQAFVRGYLEEPMRLIGVIRNVLTSALALLGAALLVLLAALYARSTRSRSSTGSSGSSRRAAAIECFTSCAASGATGSAG